MGMFLVKKYRYIASVVMMVAGMIAILLSVLGFCSAAPLSISLIFTIGYIVFMLGLMLFIYDSCLAE